MRWLSAFKFIFFLTISLFLNSCKNKILEIVIISDELKNHLLRAHFFGNIKNIETETFYFSSKDSSFILSNISVQNYSSDGYRLNLLIRDRNRDTISLKIVHYLSNAKENYWEEFNYKNYELKKDTFFYDKNGFKCAEIITLNDSLLCKIEFKTGISGSVIVQRKFISGFFTSNKFFYNNFGLLEKIEAYDSNNKLFKYINIERDNYGDEVNRRAYKSNHEMIEYTYTQYNNEGFLLKVIYDDRLHEIRENHFYSKHDNYGNWLEEIVLIGVDTLTKRVRKISYY